MNQNEQRLLALVLDRFAERFDRSAILRGGMVLRILGSARYTNDLDYVFVPFGSRNDIVEDVLACLNSIPDASVSHSLNSKCLRILFTLDKTTVQIEVKVARAMKTTLATTKLFSPQYNFPKRVIPVVDHSISLANKLAAWNERRLVRDIYDIWFFIQMNIVPDIETLEARLKKPTYSMLVPTADRYRGSSIGEFYAFVRDRVAELTDEQITNQLLDYLTPDELVGLPMMMRAALVKLR